MPTDLAAKQPDPTADALRAGRRMIFALACMGMLSIAFAGQMLPASLVPIAREFNRDLAERGVLLFLGPAGFMVSTLLSGYFSDRWGERFFILLGFGLLAGGIALTAWGPGYMPLRIGLFIIGLSGGFLESPLSAVASDAFPDRRTQVLNITQLFYNVGAVAGPAALGLVLVVGRGWRTGFALSGLIAVASLLLAVRGLPAGRVTRSAREQIGGGCCAVNWWLVGAVALAMFLYVGAEMTIAQWSANYLVGVFGTAPSRAALVVSGFWLGMGLGRTIYALLVARWGYLACALGSAVLAGGMASWAAVTQSPLLASLQCVAAGFFFGGTWPTLLSYIAHKSPGRTGTVFGIIVAAGSGGAALVPMLAGWVAEHTAFGLRSTMAIGATSTFLLAALLVVMLIRDASEASRARSPR